MNKYESQTFTKQAFLENSDRSRLRWQGRERIARSNTERLEMPKIARQNSEFVTPGCRRDDDVGKTGRMTSSPSLICDATGNPCSGRIENKDTVTVEM